jgi:hypothetical protein
MNCPCAAAAAANPASAAALAKRSSPLMAPRGLSLDELSARMNSLPFLFAVALLPGISNVQNE